MLLATLCGGPTVADSVQAIGLDEIAQQSGLGQPLRLVIPLLTNVSDEIGGEDFAGECVKLVPATANDLPQLTRGRVALEHRGDQAFVIVSTQYPINEPIMRVAVQAGCRVSLSREYTVLFDPVSIEAPMVEAATTAPVERPAPAAAMPPEPRPVVQPSVVPQSPVASVARAQLPTKPKRASIVVAAPSAPVETRMAKAADRPRLQVSRSVGDAGAVPVTRGAAEKAAAEREALKALEEETVALQRRIAELSLTMERLDQELRDARAAKAEAEQAAREAAERDAAATPGGVLRTWAEENWPLFVTSPVLILLIAVLLLSKQRRGAVSVPAPITAAPAHALDPEYLGEPSLHSTPNAGGDEAMSRPKEVQTAPNVITPVAATPPTPVPEFHYDPESAFDYEVMKTAEESSAFSTLEREQPGIVARLTNTWGTPEAAAKLQDYLLTPRRSGKPLSRGAIAELKLLQAIALEHVAGQSMETP